MNYRNTWTCIFINNIYDSLKFNLFHEQKCLPLYTNPHYLKDNYTNNFSFVIVLANHSSIEGVSL